MLSPSDSGLFGIPIVEYVWSQCRKKRLWSCNRTDRFRNEKRVCMYRYYNGLWKKAKERLTSGCSPSPAPSPHPSARCVPAEPRVMLFATGVMKTKPLYGNGFVIFEIVESRQKSVERKKPSELSYCLATRKKRVKDARMAKLRGCYPCAVTRENLPACSP